MPRQYDSVTIATDSADPTDGVSPELLRVMLVDDHDLFRTGLRNLLEEQGVHIVAEAPTETSRSSSSASSRDVVVMDLNMPGMNGIEATGRSPGSRSPACSS